MTKDLALLVGAEQKWFSTEGFLDKIGENLRARWLSRPPRRLVSPAVRDEAFWLGPRPHHRWRFDGGQHRGFAA